MRSERGTTMDEEIRISAEELRKKMEQVLESELVTDHESLVMSGFNNGLKTMYYLTRGEIAKLEGVIIKERWLAERGKCT